MKRIRTLAARLASIARAIAAALQTDGSEAFFRCGGFGWEATLTPVNRRREGLGW